ncbi:MAG: hypothetical protein ACTSQI_03195 [Candidatus Helarchaeota archaeon]
MTIKFKIVVIGNSEASKELLIIEEQELERGEKYQTNLGLDFKLQYKLLDEKNVNLVLWLMKGKKYEEIKRQLVEGADGIVVLFDIGPEKMVNEIVSRIKELRLKSPDSSILLIGKNIKNRINQIIEKYTIELIKEGKIKERINLNIDFFDISNQERLVSQEFLEFLARKLLSRTDF